MRKTSKSVSRRASSKRVRARARPRRRDQRARALETALAALAHDIRTPLGGILALSELLAASEIGERERTWALSIKETTEHLALLTTLLVDAVRAQAAGLILRRDAFRPRELADAIAALLKARAQAKGLEATISIADDLPEAVLGDPVRLRAALENLTDNAVKFTDAGSVGLAVSAKRAARGRVRLTFVVTDSGIGLRRAEIARLIRPFAQSNEEVARRYGGAGLGLVSVKRLAEAMGGGLKVTSVLGSGSTFTLSVVVEKAQQSSSASSDAGIGAQAAEASPARGLHVLCAEDNPFGRVILNTILTELGHRAEFVSSGEGACATVAGADFDAVLMDVTLSGFDGIEATRRIRALESARGRVPIIGISGRSTQADEASARAAGMDAYLTKPISAKALAETLAALTSAGPLHGGEPR